MVPEHSNSLQRFVSSDAPRQVMPPFDASMVTYRSRVSEPIPQVALHVDQTDHWLQTQSTVDSMEVNNFELLLKEHIFDVIIALPAHSPSLHDIIISVSQEQSLPPFEASIDIDRLRDLEPIPQVFVHADHSPHWCQTQFTGSKKRRMNMVLNL